MKNRLTSKLELLYHVWNRKLEDCILSRWNRLAERRRSLPRRIVVLLLIMGIVFGLFKNLATDQELYFPALMIFATSVMAFYDGTFLGVLFAIVTVLGVDFLIIPPIYTILNRPTTKATFLITTLLGLLISFLVTSLRIAFRKVSLVNDRLAEAVTARDEMIGVISHELKNPITSLQLGLAFIKKDLSRGEDREKLLRLIEQLSLSVSRMRNLVEDLLSVARIESRALQMNLTPCNLLSIIGDVLNAHDFEAKEKGLQLTARFDSDVPLGLCDCDRTFQVLSILVNNAIKFTDKGGAITILVTKKDQELEIEVRDTGKGISTEDGANLFKRFSQVRGDPARGSGLGLYIAKGLVEAQSGRIWFQSELGLGSSFYFTLKVAQSVSKMESTAA